jgi:hypothetical protein
MSKKMAIKLEDIPLNDHYRREGGDESFQSELRRQMDKAYQKNPFFYKMITFFEANSLILSVETPMTSNSYRISRQGGAIWTDYIQDCNATLVMDDSGFWGLSHCSLQDANPEDYIDQMVSEMRTKHQTRNEQAIVVGGDKEHFLRISRQLRNRGILIVRGYCDDWTSGIDAYDLPGEKRKLVRSKCLLGNAYNKRVILAFETQDMGIIPWEPPHALPAKIVRPLMKDGIQGCTLWDIEKYE